MRFMTAMKKPLLASVAAASLLTSGMVTAEVVDEKPSAGAMVVDAVFVRPLYFLLSQAGSVVYGATLPFTLLGENADEAAETLVVTPLQGAFVRCLGCGDIDNEVSALEEGNGKTIEHFVMGTLGYSSMDVDFSFAEEKIDSPNAGVYLGTHFNLTDRSRFDVLLGFNQLFLSKEKIGNGDDLEHDLKSLQLSSRFGKEVLNDLSLMFKLGFHRWKYEIEDVDSDNGTDFLWGIGADYRVSKRVGLGLEFTRYNFDGEIEDDGSEFDFDSKLNSTELSLRYYW